MTRAEERALQAYPITMVRRRYDGIARSDDPYDPNLHDRYCFQKGYEQAEKDLALTWEDVENIVHIYEIAKDVFGDYDIELYEEVLTRFKQVKEAKK